MLYRSDSGRPVTGPDADAAPLPEQAPAMDLWWLGSGDPRQRATSLCERTTAALQKATAGSWSESKSQP